VFIWMLHNHGVGANIPVIEPFSIFSLVGGERAAATIGVVNQFWLKWIWPIEQADKTRNGCLLKNKINDGSHTSFTRSLSAPVRF
jgi:hypothetical protein